MSGYGVEWFGLAAIPLARPGIDHEAILRSECPNDVFDADWRGDRFAPVQAACLRYRRRGSTLHWVARSNPGTISAI